MTVNDIIKLMPSGLNTVAAADMEKSIQFDISNPMYLLIDHGTCSAHEGVLDTADVALTMADEDLKALLKGELNGAMAFMSGKLKLKGDLMLAQKIPALFDASKIA
ncbi:Putative sterol carrier protein [Collimonas sp. OK607]|uniref:SCP2 sterol-binding domain-containing protein n=1 Tax=Collimonas sp. OK607 TaxID=1798194 RepID=UPI0008E66500|nr:SCP2 sterol-binding domain-containing protein [Collimonas sp. OK607]SFB17085.1 Putative sterol carrier protein [Collimonas sp. OK607]